MTYADQPVAAPQGFTEFGNWFSEVFRLWSARWQVWVLQGLAVLLISGGISLILSVIAGIIIITHSPKDPAIGFVTMIYGAIYGTLVLMGVTLLFLGPGMVLTALKQLRGQEISASDVFLGARYALGDLLISFTTGLGAFLCCVGIYLTAGLLFMALPLYVDRKISATDAISISWKTASGNLWLYVLFAFVLALAAGVGHSVCGIGIIVTLPWLMIGQAVAYERTFNAVTGSTSAFGVQFAGVPPPPYHPDRGAATSGPVDFLHPVVSPTTDSPEQ